MVVCANDTFARHGDLTLTRFASKSEANRPLPFRERLISASLIFKCERRFNLCLFTCAGVTPVIVFAFIRSQSPLNPANKRAHLEFANNNLSAECPLCRRGKERLGSEPGT